MLSASAEKRNLLTLIFFLLLLCCAPKLRAQGEGNIWTFGNSAGLDFNSGTAIPISMPVPTYSAFEGTATMCNASGALLMYTNGLELYDKNGTVMPNGAGLSAVSDYVSSTTQGSVIMPVPGNPLRYYVFTLGNMVLANGTLSYSVVDMGLNGGLGDVVAGQKAIPVDSFLTEKMTVITRDCNSAWLMVHERWNNKYKAYLVTAAGVDPVPVVSATGFGGTENYSIGTIRFSPDGTKMVAALLPYFGTAADTVALELYDFDRASGQLSNPLVLGKVASAMGFTYTYYGACFSPDNTKLYGSHHQKLVQFDLSLPAAADIIASHTVIAANTATSFFGGDLRTGPDGRLYVVNAYWGAVGYLHRIDYPNLAGAACQFVEDAVTLLPGTGCLLGLPNEVITFGMPDTAGTFTDTFICTTGVLKAREEAGSYLWDDGSTGRERTVTAAGIYRVQYLKDCTFHIDSFSIKQYPAPELNLGRDTVFCAGVPFDMVLGVPVPDTVPVLWSTGSTDPYLTIGDTGTYALKIYFKPCAAADTIHIGAVACDCNMAVPSAFSPNGDGLNDRFMPVYSPGCEALRHYVLQVYNRWGQLVFRSYKPERGWDGHYGGEAAGTGTYFYQLSYTDGRGQEVKRKGDVVLLR